MPVGVVAAVVVADPAGCDADMGVAAVVEGTVHLQTHPTPQAVVDDGGDPGHLMPVGRLFLDDGGDGEDGLPVRGLVGEARRRRDPGKVLSAEIKEIIDDLSFVVSERDVVTVGEDSSLGVGAKPGIRFH